MGVQPWGPPLQPPLRLTGTFGEPRNGHLHTGVDFSTGGEIGLPVLAVAAGSVVRMRAKASGYGRALYLQTDRGELVVYGHLDRFAPEIEALLYKHQLAQGEYEIDLSVALGELRFEQGDTLAFSGATGAGPPHLHLELRDGETPINPLLWGIEVPDKAEPRVGPARLRGLAPDSWVNGEPAMEFPCAHADPIPVWGTIGFEVAVLDRCGLTAARLSPLRAAVFLDGEPLFSRIFTRLDFSRGRELGRIYGRPCAGSKTWVLRMYRWPLGADPDQTEGDAGAGLADVRALSPGRHTLCFEAQDAAGYCTEASWEIEVTPPMLPVAWKAEHQNGGWLLGLRLAEPVDSLRLPLHYRWRQPGIDGAAGGGRWMPLGQGWFAARLPLQGPVEVEVSTSEGCRIVSPILLGGRGEIELARTDLRLRVDEGMVLVEVNPACPFPGMPEAWIELMNGERVPLTPRGCPPSGGWNFSIAPDAFAGQSRSLCLAFPSGEGEIPLPDLIGLPESGEALEAGWLTLQSDPGVLAGSMILTQRFAGPDDSLRVLAPLLELGPQWQPLLHPLRVSIATEALYEGPAELSERWGLYRRTSKGEWSWVGRERTQKGLGGFIKELGCFALLEDSEAPALARTDPPAGAVLPASPRRLRAWIVEIGSGFNPMQADILLDGRMMLAAWDIDEEVLTAMVSGPLDPGPHEWEVRIIDRVGNRCDEILEFTVTSH
ncbi:MAG: M23 family metallopeptidase [Candidatus Eisenbacteria sp.]|nr:M23 family metallopeptidase [Candidatus Eisenbacteria bacterium]